jgi:hypothetical protein
MSTLAPPDDTYRVELYANHTDLPVLIEGLSIATARAAARELGPSNGRYSTRAVSEHEHDHEHRRSVGGHWLELGDRGQFYCGWSTEATRDLGMVV